MPIIVPPSGDPRSRLAIVGARPGRDEVTEGAPFVGYSGRLLWKLLPMARGETYVTNVRRDFSPEHSTPTRNEILQALPILRDELERTDANILLALGKESFFALTGLESLEAWRGSILPSSLVPGKKVLGSWHPAGCLRKWSYTYVLEHDLRRATREANYPEIRRPNRVFTLDPDLDTFTAYCNALGSEISIDIETFGDRIACVGLSDRPDRAICLPFIGGSLTRSELAHAWRVLDRTLSTRGIIGQNIQFDTTRLERYGFTMPHLVFDTMLAHHLLWPELDHDLGFIVSMYTDEPYYKYEGGWQGDFQKFWTYNCLSQDTLVLMHDLTWKTLEEIQLGDKVLTLEENATGNTYGRRLVQAIVTKKQTKNVDGCIRVVSENGTLCGTKDHQVLSDRNRQGYSWKEMGGLKEDDVLIHVLAPKDKIEDYDVGWMGGIFDGEGCLEIHWKDGVGYPLLAFSQKEGEVLTRALSILTRFSFTVRRKNKLGAQYVWISGGLGETLRALSIFRPIRLLSKFQHLARTAGVGGLSSTKRPKVRKVVWDGKKTVVDITTTEGTFIANGIGVHNCKDAACTFEAAASLKRELAQASQLDYYREAVLGLIRPVMAMQSRGLCVDFDALNKTRNRLQLETKYLQLSLNQNVGFDCNVRSSTDLRYLLHECLKLPKIKLSDKTGQPSADKDVLHQYAYASEDPRQRNIFQTILDVRERRTLTSSFFHLETNEDGRYTANFLIHGTHNGRLASRKGERPGPQLQNIPPAARRVFTSSPGCLLGAGDLRRAEAMFVAYDAGEEDLISIFEDNTRDLYKEVAARALGRASGSIQKWERELFKKVVHASNYGMMYNKFVIVLRISGINIEDLNIDPITLDELVRMNPVYAKMSYDSARRSFNRLSEAARKAARILEGYHASYPKIRRWQHNIGEQTTRTRIIRDAFGRRISFLGRLDDKLVRDALSARPQGTVVGIANRALRLLHQQRTEGQIPADIVLQAHDSVMIEFPERDLEVSMRALEDALTCELMVGGRKLVIPIDLAYGKSWGTLDHAWRRAA